MTSCLQSLVGHSGLPEPKVKLDFCNISSLVSEGGVRNVPAGGAIDSRVVLNEIESLFFVWDCTTAVVVVVLFAMVEFNPRFIGFARGVVLLNNVGTSGLHTVATIFLIGALIFSKVSDYRDSQQFRFELHS